MAAFGDLLQRIARSLEEARAEQQPGDNLRARLGYGTEDGDDDDSEWESVRTPDSGRGPETARQREGRLDTGGGVAAGDRAEDDGGIPPGDRAGAESGTDSRVGASAVGIPCGRIEILTSTLAAHDAVVFPGCSTAATCDRQIRAFGAHP